MPPEAKFLNPSTTLSSEMKDVIMFFEQELAKHNGHTMTLGSFGFVGMMERDLEFVYDLLSMTPGNMDSDFDSEGSYHPLRL